ncbi:FAD/NAD(P)-binding protein (plasmid) [Rhizobium sp. CB3171]|uniref:FAD/NAD(P)-binding protein n=1 Tax=Rhizobium sp. CB3171 TaxID=3039157 RepID=UPI0024B21414|nr:FAD/NAD(P)-binding protein [Rhizobium sp. CB3171]WFU05192.1 FAD/NAD(P)-binding protein [Rhizobium sp. CB3171]
MTLLSPRIVNSGSEDVDRIAKIAIIGRGFSGIMAAIALLKRVEGPFHLVLFDPRPKIDIGEALNQSSASVLTSRVRDLSIDHDDAGDFRQWLEAEEGWLDRVTSDAEDLDDSFVPGEAFRTYVYDRFSKALKIRTDAVVQFLPDKVISIEQGSAGGLSVLTEAGESTRFDAVFLCTGYGLREGLDSTLPTIEADRAIVIGEGIQAVDKALALLDEGRASRVVLISESGFLPQSHAVKAQGSLLADQAIPRSLRGAFRFLRREAINAGNQGLGWQGIMNGFRLQARELWEGLTPDERRRFKRHVQAVYESHRNRLPPERYQRLHRAIDEGTITVRRGKIDRIANNGVLLVAPVGFEVLPADIVVDSRAHSSGTDTALVRAIVKTGLAKSDELGIGVVVDECGQTTDAPNTSRGLFAMGPLGLGSVPDVDLVPQIVEQSHRAAASVDAWLGERTQKAPDGRVTR